MGRKVLAVEASPRNFSLLDASRIENGFSNLSLVHAAISDRPGELSFMPCGPYGYVSDDPTHPWCVRVPAITVEEVLARAGWDTADFIKIDIEGSELAGLAGMAKLLRRKNAPPIYIESNGYMLNMFGETPATLKATLVDYGYRLYQVEDRGLIPVGLDDFQADTVVDYLAVKSAPTLAETWRYDPPLAHDEVIRRIQASCHSASEHDRSYIARGIRHARGNSTGRANGSRCRNLEIRQLPVGPARLSLAASYGIVWNGGLNSL